MKKKDSIRRIGADFVHTVTGKALKRGVVTLDATGKIMDIDRLPGRIPKGVEYHEGAHLVPGFVNTHCHLELSHMKGLVDTGTGLIRFITKVVTMRDFPAGIISRAIQRAEEEMYRNGIVAVGDISNQTDTFIRKSKSKLRYYTFVEVFDLLQGNVEATMAQYRPVYEALPLPQGHRKSYVPHAPYSVSDALFEEIARLNKGQCTVSIHNQETPAEDELLRYKRGELVDFYKGFGLSLRRFKKTGKASLYKSMEYLNPSQRTLFVHNTLTRREDIRAAHDWSKRVYWATCPNANLYIENRLPDYRAFMEEGARMTIGTDSLTSNWQLSVLEEMKTIQRYNSYISFGELLRWATLNGARALGMQKDLGSLSVGKRPGLNLIKGITEKGNLTGKTRVKRLV